MITLYLTSRRKLPISYWSLVIKRILDAKSCEHYFYNKVTTQMKITLLKSPHVHKKFKEHYAQNVYSTAIKVKADEKKLLSILPILEINNSSVSLVIK